MYSSTCTRQYYILVIRYRINWLSNGIICKKIVGTSKDDRNKEWDVGILLYFKEWDWGK